MPRRNRKTNKFPKSRRHTNKTGLRGIKSGYYKREIKKLARELNIPYGNKKIDYYLYKDNDIGDKKIAKLMGWELDY